MHRASWIVLTLLLVGGTAFWATTHASELRRQRLRTTFLESEVERWRERSRLLEGELFAALQQNERVRKLLSERADAERGEAERAADQSASKPRFLSPAMRAVLIALNDCLRADGHGAFRFLFASDLVDDELRGVEAIDRDPRTLRTVSLIAARATVALDRAAGSVSMTFHDGVVLRDGKREALSEAGYEARFLAVDGPMWERRVGHLLELVGDYPADPEREQNRPRLDKITASIWRNRLTELLASAATGKLTYQVATLGDLRDGEFRDVLVHGLVDGKRLQRSIEAERLTIEFDRKTGVVEMVARGGFLHETAGRSSIADTGYRMYLPGLAPDRARQLMFGMIRPAQ